jgi:hypothetical protein
MLIQLGLLALAVNYPSKLPGFSWDTVGGLVFMVSRGVLIGEGRVVRSQHPYIAKTCYFTIYQHSGNGTGPLSNDTAAFMSRFPLVTMAGFHGHGCCNEYHITEFAGSVKKANKSATVLYYQNTLINFPQTVLGRKTTNGTYNGTVPEDLLLHDKRGRLVYLGGCGSTKAAPNHTIYDHTKPEMRKMWTDNVVNVVRSNPGLVDGVFCDRSGSIDSVLTKDLHCYEFEAGLKGKWDKGHWQAVADTMAALKPLIPAAIVIGNHAEWEKSMGLTANSTWNGKMFEHFVPDRPYIPAGDQLVALKKDARFPGGLIAEAHVDFCNTKGNNDMYKRSLAAFLIGASEHDYYACTSGWGFDDGWSHWPADYDRPLGAPNGTAVKTATGWRRKFASGTEVWLETKDQTDSKWGSSCIRWADGHVTRSGNLCKNYA